MFLINVVNRKSLFANLLIHLHFHIDDAAVLKAKCLLKRPSVAGVGHLDDLRVVDLEGVAQSKFCNIL